MPKRIRSPAGRSGSSAVRTKAEDTPGIVHTSLYLPAAVHDALREIAFKERLKIYDIVLEGIEAALRRRGYAPIENLKRAGK